ncbi:MAG: efflux RND transporter periplasmic adaptor subunit [Selenomonadaceae bacterium]|nr:efflux RND transporter periplasmic adaptor subunit [Selenomonadaceae bacterium]
MIITRKIFKAVTLLKEKFLAGIIAASFLFAGCSAEEVQTPKPPLVKVQKISLTNVASEENYSGVVRGRYETNLSFQVGGKIISRDVQTGSRVRAGEILMTLDPKDVLEQNRGAEAQVASTLAQLKLAKNNFDRYSELFKSAAIAAVVLDQYKTELDAAQAAYDAAVAQAQQNRNALEYTTLTADADGIISNINAEVGQVVAAGQNVLTLVQTNEFEVVVNIPENKISAVQIGQPVTIDFWATRDVVSGIVREISPMADSASRTFTVKVSLPEISNVQLGMTANVSLRDEISPNAIILPLSAIYQTGDAAQVWLVDGGKVSLKKIEVTTFDDNNVRVRGLNSGDVVVVAGVQKLHDGQEVRTGD